MLPTQVIVALLVLQLALVVPLVAVVIQLLRLFHWRFRADPQTRGERPHFTGPVLALLFSALAAITEAVQAHDARISGKLGAADRRKLIGLLGKLG